MNGGLENSDPRATSPDSSASLKYVKSGYVINHNKYLVAGSILTVMLATQAGKLPSDVTNILVLLAAFLPLATAAVVLYFVPPSIYLVDFACYLPPDELKVVRTHTGMDDASFKSIQLTEDSQGRYGLSVSRDFIEISTHALNANLAAALSPLVPLGPDQSRFLLSHSLMTNTAPATNPCHKMAFEHVCILATSKRMLDEVQKTLDLSDENMEASRETLERFGNTSSSGIWYELAYLESKNRIKCGDRVWQLALGSGIKCNSARWEVVRDVGQVNRKPWIF